MRFRNALLRLALHASPIDIPRLSAAARLTSEKLYVQMNGSWNKLGAKSIERRLGFVYREVQKIQPGLDVRVLLPGPGFEYAKGIVDLESVLCAANEEQQVERMNDLRKAAWLPPFETVVLPEMPHNDAELQSVEEEQGEEGCGWVDSASGSVVGGTFDHMHYGHKILISMACLKAKDLFVCGVSADALLTKKTLKQLLEPLDERIFQVADFVTTIKPSLQTQIVPLHDGFGPSVVVENLQCIVVSQETATGGILVSNKRVENGLNAVEVMVIECESNDDDNEDVKMSSTWRRKQVLGMHKTVSNNEHDDDVSVQYWGKRTSSKYPYCIGISGPIGGGKSTAAKNICTLMQAAYLNCDLLGHKVYETSPHIVDKLQSTFGSSVIAADGTVNRKQLGDIVFADKAKLQQLNNLVWPEILKLAKEELGKMKEKVCVVEGAVFLNDPMWTEIYDELWITYCSETAAVHRLQQRNNLSEEEAMVRIKAQLPLQEYVDKADVVIFTEHDVQVTMAQLKKAIAGVEIRLKNMTSCCGLKAQFQELLRCLRIEDDDAGNYWWRVIRDHYTQPTRKYHNLSHIQEMMVLFEECRTHLCAPQVVQLAIFFHDIIYNPKSNKNEEESAALFTKFSEQVSLPLDLTQAVGAMIIRTADHMTGPAHDDLALFLDMDLAILGSHPRRYCEYARAIRHEYVHVTDANFASARAAFLSKFLQHERLYFTDHFYSKLEKTARWNIEAEIKRLSQ